MTAAWTKQHEEKHTGVRKEKKNKRRKQGKKAKIILKASIVAKLPVSATKPSGGPCHTICNLPNLVDSGVTCQYYRYRAPPL